METKPEKLVCAYSGVAANWTRGNLSPKDAADFIEHLGHCPSCQEEERHARVVILWSKCREDVLNSASTPDSES